VSWNGGIYGIIQDGLTSQSENTLHQTIFCIPCLLFAEYHFTAQPAVSNY